MRYPYGRCIRVPWLVCVGHNGLRSPQIPIITSPKSMHCHCRPERTYPRLSLVGKSPCWRIGDSGRNETEVVMELDTGCWRPPLFFLWHYKCPLNYASLLVPPTKRKQIRIIFFSFPLFFRYKGVIYF